MKIVIDGCIGAGKSTLMRGVHESTRMPIFLEPVHYSSWQQFIECFYNDTARWALAFNLKVLCDLSGWSTTTACTLYERSPSATRDVSVQLQVEDGTMTNLELQVFDQLYPRLTWWPDVLIYLRTSPEHCQLRIQQRV